MTDVALARPSAVSSRWRSPDTTSEAVALHPRDRLRHRGPALLQPLGDPGAQRGDALLLELEDRLRYISVVSMRSLTSSCVSLRAVAVGSLPSSAA